MYSLFSRSGSTVVPIDVANTIPDSPQRAGCLALPSLPVMVRPEGSHGRRRKGERGRLWLRL
jgi:hypothetical protein